MTIKEKDSAPDLTREKQIQKWAMWAHASALGGFIFPFGNVIGPWLVWRYKGEEFPEIVPHAKAALNFQITLALYVLVSIVLLLVWIGVFLLIAIAVYQLLSILLATLEAHDLDVYKYPLGRKFVD